MNNVFEIIYKEGHYVMQINQKFYRIYGTFSEAVREIERIRAKKG